MNLERSASGWWVTRGLLGFRGDVRKRVLAQHDAADGIDHRGHAGFIGQPVEDDLGLTPGFNQTFVAKLCELAGKIWLFDTKRRLDIADRHFLVAQLAADHQSRRVRKRLQKRCRLIDQRFHDVRRSCH